MLKLALFALFAILVNTVAGEPVPDQSVNIIQSDDTARALVVVNDAGDRKDLALLMQSFQGGNVATHVATLSAIEQLDVASQRTALIQILQQDNLWNLSIIGGEAHMAKRIFGETVKCLAGKLTNTPAETNLFGGTQKACGSDSLIAISIL